MTLYPDISGERLDAFLARSVDGLSRSAAQKLLEDGCVTRNGKPGKKNDKLEPGDSVELTIPEPKAVDIEAKEIPLDSVYEDEDTEDNLRTVVEVILGYGAHLHACEHVAALAH